MLRKVQFLIFNGHTWPTFCNGKCQAAARDYMYMYMHMYMCMCMYCVSDSLSGQTHPTTVTFVASWLGSISRFSDFEVLDFEIFGLSFTQYMYGGPQPRP